MCQNYDIITKFSLLELQTFGSSQNMYQWTAKSSSLGNLAIVVFLRLSHLNL